MMRQEDAAVVGDEIYINEYEYEYECNGSYDAYGGGFNHAWLEGGEGDKKQYI